MRHRSSERLGSAAGLIAAVAVGVPVLADLVAGDGDLVGGPTGLWWGAYVVFLVAFVIDLALAGPRADRTRMRVLLGIEVAAASAVHLADASYGWVAVLLVVTAASGAYSLTPRLNGVQVLAQSAVIGLGVVTTGDGAAGDALLAVVVYGGFQAFAALVVRSEQREADARADLAAANVELRATSALLSRSAQATERLRIARDLHDVVGHQLTALSLELEVASHHSGAASLSHVLRARDTAKSLLGDVRDAVGDLRAPDGPLAETLRELVDDLPGPAIALDIVDGSALIDDHTVTIVRCVQELVTNTLRYADAERLWITVRTGAEGVTVTARDDGRGAAVVREGNGLTGMRERLDAVGGGLSVATRPGAGFSVTAHIPAASEPM